MKNDPPLPDEVPCVLQPERAEEVDEDAYLAANPDAAKAGKTASAHFRAVGRAEGRLQLANLDTVARLRAHKLARIQWLRQPISGFVDGEAPNFLSVESVEAFGIPEDVPVSAHQYGAPVVEMIQSNRAKLFLDVGAGLRHIYYANVVNTDIYRSVCTDVICVGETLPFADEQFDGIFCFAVLEHTMRPWDVAREMCRVLKPGGTIMVDWPFLQPVHGYPHHYFNATPAGNRSLFDGFCDVTSVEIQRHHHPAIAIQWILTSWRDGLPARMASKLEAMTVGNLIKDDIESQLDRDYCVELRSEAKKAIASGSMMTAVKRAVSIQGSTSDPDSAWAGLALQNAALRNELDRMLRSRYWRLTEPLRALMRVRRSLTMKLTTKLRF
jgi:SAM-dependent methyltransferase